MTRPDEAYVTLALIPGIGRSRLSRLLATFGSARAALDARFTDLLAVRGMSRAAATAVVEASPDLGARAIRKTAECGGALLTPGDDRFPAALRPIPDAPTLLFVKGDLALMQRPAVAIVGSRHHSRYGDEVCRHFAGELARAGLVVVSGMARGLDAVAHHAALDAGGATVGVLGNGLGVVYPAANRALYERVEEGGCLMTEFPPGERPHAGSFPRRNRLISGLAAATVVVEARERSGTLITVDCALAQGREVFAVPGPISSPTSVGCNRLIQQGARPALTIEDVLEEYGVAAADALSDVDLTPEDREVLVLLERGACSADDVALALGWPIGRALATLTGLELHGVVACDPGKVFHLAISPAGQQR